ncbi:hypothetical protein [Leucobacter luti]|uniref:hypothetical protein n=1 Tax=Leucobacter luti TaxID=340320 RepID=UPI003D036A81
MSFDLEREQRAAAARLSTILDRDVAAARARIHNYTATEEAEVAAGLRPTKRQRDRERLAASVEEFGRMWGVNLKAISTIAAAFNRGFSQGVRK